MTAPIRIGTSGWSYPDWHGTYYPQRLPARGWLAFYAGHFPTVELNSSFYRQPTAGQFAHWATQVPDPFVFAVKAPRFITHGLRLRHVRIPLRRFQHALGGLGPKLGPVLYQLPPNLAADLPLLDRFAATLAPNLSHAIEFRHTSWFHDETFALLRRHGIALCWSDYTPAPAPHKLTAPFLYARLHGGTHYDSEYTRTGLRTWARILQKHAATGVPSFVYFNNTSSGQAVHNALGLQKLTVQAVLKQHIESNPKTGVLKGG
jgi:uncharacterized protein YecE (DUF72 family)